MTKLYFSLDARELSTLLVPKLYISLSTPFIILQSNKLRIFYHALSSPLSSYLGCD
jgi:hypothetical protein